MEIAESDLGDEKENVEEQTWADIVGNEDHQTLSQSHWRNEEPLIKEGIKIAQIDAEEVKTQVANWSSAVICMVLGANPLFAVFEGFIQRMWGKLEIAQIVRMNGGFTIVKFNDDATRDHVLEHRVIPFDRKSGEAKQWVKKEVKRGGSRQEKTWDIVDQTKTKGAKVMGADEKDKEEVRMGNEFRIQGGDTLGNSGVQVLVRQRKRREENRIASYVNNHGTIVDNYPDVVKHYIDHFKSYMGSCSSVNRRLDIISNSSSFTGPLPSTKPILLLLLSTKVSPSFEMFSPGANSPSSPFNSLISRDFSFPKCRALLNSPYRFLSKLTELLGNKESPGFFAIGI
ncbi:hypothetical protein G4B88_023124 [Cannabis sativa]|uniref:DUF4283 domain-containing protein n=1 Tax=Cannabis sativa TaxID=3483 RepID=A0A7J6G6M1_CANSA|nr:hypothetical protein G4B88_023124 [Cannabis sativa]